MLQSQARRILYETDDVWEQTAADNPEWLDLFKKAHSLNIIPSCVGLEGQAVPEDLELYQDLGLRIPFSVMQKQGSPLDELPAGHSQPSGATSLQQNPFQLDKADHGGYRTGRDYTPYSSLVVPSDRAVNFETMHEPTFTPGKLGRQIITTEWRLRHSPSQDQNHDRSGGSQSRRTPRLTFAEFEAALRRGPACANPGSSSQPADEVQTPVFANTTPSTRNGSNDTNGPMTMTTAEMEALMTTAATTGDTTMSAAPQLQSFADTTQPMGATTSRPGIAAAAASTRAVWPDPTTAIANLDFDFDMDFDFGLAATAEEDLNSIAGHGQTGQKMWDIEPGMVNTNANTATDMDMDTDWKKL